MLTCPTLSNSKTSKLKVENVVSPPISPVVIKSFKLCDSISANLKYEIKIPISKLPIILTNKVCKGKVNIKFEKLWLS